MWNTYGYGTDIFMHFRVWFLWLWHRTLHAFQKWAPIVKIMLLVFIFLNGNKNDGGNNSYKKKGKCYVTSNLSRCLFMNWVFNIISFAYHRIIKNIF